MTSFPRCSTPCWPQRGGAGAAWSRGSGGGGQGADEAAGCLRPQRQGPGQRRLPESRAPAPLQPRAARLPLCRRLLPRGKGEGELHKAPPAWDGAPTGRFFTWGEMEARVQMGQERKGWHRMGMEMAIHAMVQEGWELQWDGMGWDAGQAGPGDVSPGRWPMTRVTITTPSHGWRRLSASSASPMADGTWRTGAAWRMLWTIWPSPTSWYSHESPSRCPVEPNHGREDGCSWGLCSPIQAGNVSHALSLSLEFLRYGMWDNPGRSRKRE